MKRIVEIWMNGKREYCRAFSECGDVDAAIRVCKKRVCRRFGVEPKTDQELARRMMEDMQAYVDTPGNCAAIVESMDEITE